MGRLILAINPGSTSTKIGLFEEDALLFKETIDHTDLGSYGDILEQKEMRGQAIEDCLERRGFAIENLSAVAGRGGILPPVKTGGYIVNDRMIDYLRNKETGRHASDLGALLADEIAEKADCRPAYIYDAVSAGELLPIAQITGLPQVKRTGFCHVLNSRAAAIRYAASIGREYADLRLLVAHLGGGISVSAHIGGTIVDSIADDTGPFAPERSGSIPLLSVIDLCFSGRYSKKEMAGLVRGMGGLKALLGTADVREIESRIEQGDEYAKLVLDAQVYQIAKSVCLLAAPLRGDCDAVILTGGLARSEYVVEGTKEYINFLAPVVVLPGEFELEALAEGVLRILNGKETVHEM